MGDVKAKAGIFCYLCEDRVVLFLRLVESRKLMVVYSISVVDDRALRHSRVIASDALRNTYGYSPAIVKDMVDSVRDMYASVPGASIDDFTVRLDPLVPGGVPVQLVPVRSDDFGGEWILDIPAECPAGASSSKFLASPHAPSTPNARPAAAAAASASPNWLFSSSGARQGVLSTCRRLVSIRQGHHHSD